MSLLLRSLSDRFNNWRQSLREQAEKRTKLQLWLIVGGGLTVIVVLGRILAVRRRKQVSPLVKEKTPYQLVKNNISAAENEFDVIIAGGGLSGAACAYFLAKKGLGVLVLEKESSGARSESTVDDIVPMSAQKILQEIGILKACAGNAINKTTFATSKTSATYSNKHDTTGVVYKNALGVKPSLLRENLVSQAKKVGATVYDGHTVDRTRWSPVDKMFTIDVLKNDEKYIFKSRVVVLADGAKSELAKKIKLIKTDADAVRSHVIVPQKQMTVDHIISYPKSLSPGFCSLTKYSDGDVGFTTTLLSGNSRVQLKDIHDLHRSCASEESLIRDVLGSTNDEKINISQFHTGGVERTFKDHLLVIGEAAGLIDPLTGNSISYALESAKIAAEVIHEGFQYGNLSDRNLRRYQERWQIAFESNFHWSMKIRQWIVAYPVIMEAAVRLSKRRGNEFASELSQVLLGARSKSWFLRPDVLCFFLYEIVRLSLFN